MVCTANRCFASFHRKLDPGQPKVVWDAQGRTLAESGGALGEFWEALYIKKLPINRPCGRYVIPALQTNVVGGEGSQDSLDGARNRCSKKG